MKIPALITVAALTCGAAFAQGSTSTTDRDSAAKRNAPAAVSAEKPKAADDGIVSKTKRAFSRMGDKIRGVGKKSADNSDKTAQQTDTRTMGAAGSDTSDAGRRARMDEAYAKSQKSKPLDK